YSRLLLSERLFPHLRETEEAAEARLEQATRELAARNPPPDKAGDPAGWTAAMNALKAQAEEMALHELIYS
ncbi:MAG: TnpV protein, partial [Clostridiales bacterium]|nr:TnpV protein [Clostridiales bacterium]